MNPRRLHKLTIFSIRWAELLGFDTAYNWDVGCALANDLATGVWLNKGMRPALAQTTRSQASLSLTSNYIAVRRCFMYSITPRVTSLGTIVVP
jgi:hypothetical protein